MCVCVRSVEKQEIKIQEMNGSTVLTLFFPTAMPFTIYFKNTIRNYFDAISKRTWHSGTLNVVSCTVNTHTHTHTISEVMMKRANERCNETTYITKAQMRSLIMMTMNAMWKQCKISLINFTPDMYALHIRYSYVVLETLKARSLFFSFMFFSLFVSSLYYALPSSLSFDLSFSRTRNVN